MTRSDVQGFVELLPVDDDSDLWDDVAKYLAEELVKRISDLDPSAVLAALCKAPADTDPPTAAEPAAEEPAAAEPATEEPAAVDPPVTVEPVPAESSDPVADAASSAASADWKSYGGTS